jgi:iron complex transport system substrate-binding protein
VIRVAALFPAATEIVVALGAADQLVAVTHACSLPRGAAGVARVTRSRIPAGQARDVDAAVSDLAASGAPLYDLDEAALAALRPDVILTQAVCEVCAVREGDVRALAARLDPAPRVVSLGSSTLDGILADIGVIGAAVGMPDDAAELVAGLRSRIRRVHEQLKHSTAPRPTVAVIEWTDPVFGAGHWVPDTVRRAGGRDVVGETGAPSKRIAADQVAERNPEVIVVAPCGLALADATTEARIMLARPEWAWAAGRAAWAIDASTLTSGPGPGTVRAIEVLASILHPTLFNSPSPRLALRVDS